MRWNGHVWIASIAALMGATGACSDGPSYYCPYGTEGCPCQADSSCNTGLSCVSNACIDQSTGGSGSGGEGAAMGTGGAVAGTGAVGAGGSGATGAVNPTGGAGPTGGVAPTGGAGPTGGVQPTGGVLPTGGAEPTGGAGATTGCEADPYLPNLVNPTGWVGCDPESSADDPLGIQGAFYAFGDGLACDPPEGNPCTSAGCCLEGETVVDDTYAAWGCTMAMELSSSGGDPSVKSAYDGPATCFEIELTGTSGGNPVRIQFTQSASPGSNGEPEVSPFLEIPAVTGSWSGLVCFGDVDCPSWADADQCVVSGDEYDLQIQVPGGDRASSFELCLTSVIPQ